MREMQSKTLKTSLNCNSWLCGFFLGNIRFPTQGRSQKCLCQAAAKALRRKKVNGPKNWPRFSFHMEGDLISFSPFIASYFGIEWTQLASGQKIHLSVFIIFLLKAAFQSKWYWLWQNMCVRPGFLPNFRNFELKTVAYKIWGENKDTHTLVHFSRISVRFRINFVI